MNQTSRPTMLHALSVDVEDWPQSTLDHDLPITERAVRNTHELLALFDEHNVRGTFFILGKLADRYPGLVTEIADAGHEVASHGWSHRPVFELSPSDFLNELVRSVGQLENITGRKVLGYRAPDFSITGRTLWALDLIADRGLEYDSSIFPVQLRRYGIGNAPRTIHRLGNGLIEVPMSSVHWAGRRWPIAGGGYLRLLPYALTRRAIRRLECEQMPAVLYLHPYEIDPRELREIGHRVPLGMRITQGLNRRHIRVRLARLFREFRFGPIRDVVKAAAVATPTAVTA